MRKRDPKHIVEAGYDAIADRFAAWQATIEGSGEDRFLSLLAQALPRSPNVLELGCGARVRAAELTVAGGRLTGVDISGEQIRRARERVPGATFVHADVTEATFAPATFDAIVALFVLAHLPRTDIHALLPRAGDWLRPGGWFLTTMGARGWGEHIEEDWLGVPMFFSSLDAEESRRLVESAGLEIAQDEVIAQREAGHGTVEFLWILARRPIVPGESHDPDA